MTGQPTARELAECDWCGHLRYQHEGPLAAQCQHCDCDHWVGVPEQDGGPGYAADEVARLREALRVAAEHFDTMVAKAHFRWRTKAAAWAAEAREKAEGR